MIARVHYHFHYHFHYRYHYENIDLYCSSGNSTLVLAESPQLQIANYKYAIIRSIHPWYSTELHHICLLRLFI